MKRIIFPLSKDMEGAKISNLHDALIRIGYKIENDEVSKQYFGNSTEKAISNFQKTNRISKNFGGIDKNTADLINNNLLWTLRQYTIVHGRINDKNNNFLKGVWIIIRSNLNQEMGKCQTNERGYYSIIIPNNLINHRQNSMKVYVYSGNNQIGESDEQNLMRPRSRFIVNLVLDYIACEQCVEVFENDNWTGRVEKFHPGFVKGWEIMANDKFNLARLDDIDVDSLVALSGDGCAIGVFDVTEDGPMLIYHECSKNNKLFGEIIGKQVIGDFDGDGLDELFIITQNKCGILKFKNRNFEKLFSNETSRIFSKNETSHCDLRLSATFCVGDFDGDGADEILVGLVHRRYLKKNDIELWLLKLNPTNNELFVEAHKPIDELIPLVENSSLIPIDGGYDYDNGWAWGFTLRNEDKIIVGDFNDNGQDEIIVYDGNHTLLGYLTYEAKNKKFKTRSITYKFITRSSHIQPRCSDWSLHKYDSIIATDLDGDGKKEILVSAMESGSNIGVIKANGNALQTIINESGKIIGASGGVGPVGAIVIGTDWELKRGDILIPGDCDGDGCDEVFTTRENGQQTGLFKLQYVSANKPELRNHINQTSGCYGISNQTPGQKDNYPQILSGKFDFDKDEKLFVTSGARLTRWSNRRKRIAGIVGIIDSTQQKHFSTTYQTDFWLQKASELIQENINPAQFGFTAKSIKISPNNWVDVNNKMKYPFVIVNFYSANPISKDFRPFDNREFSAGYYQFQSYESPIELKIPQIGTSIHGAKVQYFNESFGLGIDPSTAFYLGDPNLLADVNESAKPRFENCTECDGTGRDNNKKCSECNGSGKSKAELAGVNFWNHPFSKAITQFIICFILRIERPWPLSKLYAAVSYKVYIYDDPCRILKTKAEIIGVSVEKGMGRGRIHSKLVNAVRGTEEDISDEINSMISEKIDQYNIPPGMKELIKLRTICHNDITNLGLDHAQEMRLANSVYIIPLI